eukprot:gene34297-41511_t
MDSSGHTYSFIGKSTSHDAENVYYKALNIRSKATPVTSYNIFAKNYVLIKVASCGPTSYRLCLAQVQSFAQRKRAPECMVVHLTWCYHKEDALALPSLANHPFVRDMTEKEVWLSDHADSLDVESIDATCFVVFFPPHITPPSFPPPPITSLSPNPDQTLSMLSLTFIARYELSMAQGRRKESVRPIDAQKIRQYLTSEDRAAAGSLGLFLNLPKSIKKHLRTHPSNQAFWSELQEEIELHKASSSVAKDENPPLADANQAVDVVQHVDNVGKAEEVAVASGNLVKEEASSTVQMQDFGEEDCATGGGLSSFFTALNKQQKSPPPSASKKRRENGQLKADLPPSPEDHRTVFYEPPPPPPAPPVPFWSCPAPALHAPCVSLPPACGRKKRPPSPPAVDFPGISFVYFV